MTYYIHISKDNRCWAKAFSEEYTHRHFIFFQLSWTSLATDILLWSSSHCFLHFSFFLWIQTGFETKAAFVPSSFVHIPVRAIDSFVYMMTSSKWRLAQFSRTCIHPQNFVPVFCLRFLVKLLSLFCVCFYAGVVALQYGRRVYFRAQGIGRPSSFRPKIFVLVLSLPCLYKVSTMFSNRNGTMERDFLPWPKTWKTVRQTRNQDAAHAHKHVTVTLIRRSKTYVMLALYRFFNYDLGVQQLSIFS